MSAALRGAPLGAGRVALRVPRGFARLAVCRASTAAQGVAADPGESRRQGGRYLVSKEEKEAFMRDGCGRPSSPHPPPPQQGTG